MKKLFKRLNKLDETIKRLKSEISQMDVLNYYLLNPELKERDKQQALFDLKIALCEKEAVLDSLSIQINIEKQKVSFQEKLILKL